MHIGYGPEGSLSTGLTKNDNINPTSYGLVDSGNRSFSAGASFGLVFEVGRHSDLGISAPDSKLKVVVCICMCLGLGLTDSFFEKTN